MDSKIEMTVVCIHCDTPIVIAKKIEKAECKFTCPECHHKLHVLFNTSVNPQTYSFISVNQPGGNQHSSQNAQSEEKKDGGHSEEPKKEKPNKDKTVYKKKVERAEYYDDVIPGEESTPKKKKSHRTPPPIFLTRKKFFGFLTEKYQLKSDKTTIGREDDDDPSDIMFSCDSRMSRKSISIEVKEDDYGFDFVLKVLNATNPVFLNGKELRNGEKTYIDFGDTITLGDTDLIFDNK